MEVTVKYILVDLQLHVKMGDIQKGLNEQCTDSTAVGLHYATGCHNGCCGGNQHQS